MRKILLTLQEKMFFEDNIVIRVFYLIIYDILLLGYSFFLIISGKYIDL